jgi:hypothetical protein
VEAARKMVAKSTQRVVPSAVLDIHFSADLTEVSSVSFPQV